MGRGRGLTDGSNEQPSFGKAGPLMLFVGCKGAVASKRSAARRNLAIVPHTDPVFMVTKEALLSFQQKALPFLRWGHFGIVFLPLSKKGLPRGHCMISSHPTDPGFYNILREGKWRKHTGSALHSENLSLLKGSFMTLPASYWFISSVDQKSLD